MIKCVYKVVKMIYIININLIVDIMNIVTFVINHAKIYHQLINLNIIIYVIKVLEIFLGQYNIFMKKME